MSDIGFHNHLNSAELERLALLGEDCAEVGKEIGKIVRHGYASRNPDVADSPTNREDLEREIGDLLWAIDMMAHCGDVSLLRARADAGRHARKTRYLHHQNGEGVHE